jgi:hypothetical protein
MNPFLFAQESISTLINDTEITLNDLLQEPDLFDDEVLSTIHHDLRNDLNLLTNYSEILDSNGSDGEVVHVISKKLAGSMNALMISLRLESGALEPSPEDLDAVELAEERIDWLRPLYDHLDRNFIFTVENSPSRFTIDHQFLELIFDSLLILGSEEPEGETEMILSGKTESAPDHHSITLRQNNPPWREERTAELENTLREEPLQKLVSNFSARVGLLLHTVRMLLETQGGHLDISSAQDGRVLLRAMLRPRTPEPD